MTIINTARNRVHAHAIGDDDMFVRVSWVGYDEAGNRVLRHMPYQPITEYEACVEWAKGMADQMAHQLHVLPLSYSDIRNTDRFHPICDAVASMDDQQRGAMRRHVVNSMCEVLRDCDDRHVRADAYNILHQLKVIHHDR